MTSPPFAAWAALCLLVSLPLSASPLITEFVASNDRALYDSDGDSSDYLELHNPTESAIDLGDYYLTNDPGDRTKWRLPSPTNLPAGGYLIVFASNKDRTVGELHTNFRLSKKEGGYLALIDPDGQSVVSEYANYPEQFDDFSYGVAQTGSSTTTALVKENDPCTWIVPVSDIGTSWRDVIFDDSDWQEATTGIGYERSGGYENFFGAGGDVEDDTYNRQTTVYIRIPFTVDSVEGLTGLLLRMKYDDGFIAYLNGVEVASGNPPDDEPAWNSAAGDDHSDSLAREFENTDLAGHLGELREGNNVLAIHLLNRSRTSSDLLALPRIEADFVSDPGFGEVGYFQQPSPGAVNGTDQGLPAGPVTFTLPGRGFSGVVNVGLETESPSAQIRYTTNGNVPTANSTLYTTPIRVSSSTLIRARAFEANLAPGPLAEEGYIRLSNSALNFSSDIPVVVMERFSGGPTAANGKSFTFFAFFEPDPSTGRTRLNGPYSLGTRGGWKVRGSSSSGFSKKAFSIEAWNEFNRNKDISPLGLPEESDWILNARSVFDRSLMRNAFIYELSNQVGRYAVRTRFVELFKDDNGGDLSFSSDYDGVYTFMEKISRDPERVDVERLPASVNSEPGIKGGYMLKIDRLDPGDGGLSAGGRTLGWVYPKEEDVSSAQATWIRNYINDMNSALNAPNYADPIEGYEKYIDVDSWIDHHLLNVLTLNADALRLSTYFFKAREGKLEFGPIWDFDRSMESTDGRDNNPSTWQGGTNYFTYPWWNRLFTDENFWQRYIDRYFELRQGAFSTSNVHAIIDGMASELSEAQVRNFQRWNDQPRFGGYQGEVNHLKNWLATRLSWMDNQFAPVPRSSRPSGVYQPGSSVSLTANLRAGQKIYYTLDGTDPRPTTAGSTVQGTLLFDESQPVRVHIPTANIGTAWRGGSEFVDSAWIGGTNGVGYERSSGYEDFINVNVDAQMANRTSCYIRIPFNVDDDEFDTWNFMTLQLRYDDGFVAYLNGVRLTGVNDPSPLDHNSSARQTNDDGSATTYEAFNVTAQLSSLRRGDNILAIHALNESTRSSDFLMQARIVAGFDEDGGGGPGGIEYTGPIVLNETARLVARVFDPAGGHSTSSGRTPVGTGWSAPLRAEFLVNEVPASSANLAISEIMVDPYSLGDDVTPRSAFEWLEVHNHSVTTVSLSGLRFLDGIQFDFPSQSLAGGERAVIVRNRAAFEQVYGTGTRIIGEFDLGFDSAGERLTLFAANRTVIASFEYGEDDWPEDAENGYSLRYDSGDPADGSNWGRSRHLLGSPGAADSTHPEVIINEVLTNSVAPQTDRIELHNPNLDEVDISHWFLTDDLSHPTKFQLPEDTIIPGGGYLTLDESDFNPTPGVDPSFALASDGEEIYLVAADTDGTRLHYVTGFDFGDASAGVSFGRHTISTEVDHYVPLVAQTFGGPNATPVAGPLVITELMYNPAPFESEFIEIQNVSGQAVSLAGAEVSGVGFVFDDTTPNLAPGGILVLSQIEPDAFRAAYDVLGNVPIYGPYPGRLDNGGERVRVRLPEAGALAEDPSLLVAVDTVIYSDDAPWPSAADGDGPSLERQSLLEYGGEPLHWAASEVEGGTPGVVGEQPTNWRFDFFTPAELADPDVSGPFADADGDRLVNALEYLLGTDLRIANSRNGPTVSVIEDGENLLIDLTFTLREGVTEFEAVIEQSGDLRTWSEAQDITLQNSSSENGIQTVTYRLAAPPTLRQDLYFRVRAVAR